MSEESNREWNAKMVALVEETPLVVSPDPDFVFDEESRNLHNEEHNLTVVAVWKKPDGKRLVKVATENIDAWHRFFGRDSFVGFFAVPVQKKVE